MINAEIAQRYRLMQRYVGWTDEDARRVSGLRAVVAPHADALIDDFYAEIRRHPEAAQVITGGPEQIRRLSKSLRQWLEELLGGCYDDAYMNRRWKVGYRHVEIGLAQRFASLALSRLRAGIVRCVRTDWKGEPTELAESLQSFNKLVDLDHALIQDAYEYEHVRRERQSERERGERQFRHLVENASCLIVILRCDRSAAYFNHYAEQAMGVREDELDREGGVAVLGGDAGKVAERIDEIFANGRPCVYEIEALSQNGTSRWINWSLSRIDDFDDGPAILAVGQDVTEQRRSAQELLKSSRLATIGEMYARLAHESRNALQRMRVCSEMLADYVQDGEPAAGLIERSQMAQADLQRLFDEVRSFAAPVTLDRTECRLPALWREAWHLLHTASADRRAELKEIVADVPAAILADRFHLVQAFRNIFENALAACQDRALIRVKCRTTVAGDQPSVEITIEDDGPGFDESSLNRVFEPFFTTRSSGTGLGLAIVRQTIDAHGGKVSAGRGELGGARVTILMPIDQPA